MTVLNQADGQPPRQPTLVFSFVIACELCGKDLEWTNEIGSQPQDDGSEQFAIAVVPHTCDLEGLKDICRVGGPGKQNLVDEDELWEVLTEKASRVGWHLDDANAIVMAARESARSGAAE
jgi:hypothetical protein